MEPYRPSGKFSSADLTILVAAALVTGAVVGGIAHLIGLAFRLIILFPLGMGLAVGFVAAYVTGWRSIRAPLIVALIAAVGGLTAWSTDLFLGYVVTRLELKNQITEIARVYEGYSGIEVPTARIGATVNETLHRWGRGEEMGHVQVVATLTGESMTDEDGTSFEPGPPVSAIQSLVGWTRATVSAGTSIGRFGSDGTDVGPTGTLILWGIEILLVTGTAAYMGYKQAREPFCESCGQWFGESAGIVGVADAKDSKTVVEAVKRGDPSLLTSVYPEGDLVKPLVGLRLQRCPGCEQGPVFTEVVRVDAGRKGDHEKVLVAGLVPFNVIQSLGDALKRKAEEDST